MTPDDHFQRLAWLLDLEARAEAEQLRQRAERLSAAEAETRGDCLTGLVVRDEQSGLGGRVVLVLGKRNLNQPLPWTRLGVGSPVVLSPEGGGNGVRGVVCERREGHIQVAVNDLPEDDDEATYRLD